MGQKSKGGGTEKRSEGGGALRSKSKYWPEDLKRGRLGQKSKGGGSISSIKKVGGHFDPNSKVGDTTCESGVRSAF